MICSMTGYGRGEAADRGYHITVEIKTVNNRYLDVSIKAPRIFAAYEDVVRNTIRKKLTRGHAVTFIDGLDKSVVLGEVAVPKDGSVAEELVPEPPEHDGYLFTGWSAPHTNITRTTRIYANYLRLSTGSKVSPLPQTAGDMATGSKVADALGNTSIHLIDNDGTASEGWRYVGGDWYFAKDGVAQVGMVDDGGTSYYLGSDGAMRTGWVTGEAGMDRFFCFPSGAVAKGGWFWDSGAWYWANDDGSIKLGGMTITDRDSQAREISRSVGMVFQSFNLFPHMTALENVMLAPRRVLKKSAAECRALAQQMLEKVGLGDRLDYYPSSLSGGQQQRVAIARALAMSPKVLLCDEITSALDPELVGEVLKVLEQLAAEGMTLILVTHEMNFAREVGDRVVFMHQGRVWEQGDSKTLFANPQTSELKQFISSVRGLN